MRFFSVFFLLLAALGLNAQTQNMPTRGLPPEARITTPGGWIEIQNLKPGMKILSTDANGKSIVVYVQQVNVLPVYSPVIVHLRLADHRELWAMDGHPLHDGRPIGQIQIGDIVDRSEVMYIEKMKYKQNYVFDLFPEGPTGTYLADNVQVRSTLTSNPSQPTVNTPAPCGDDVKVVLAKDGRYFQNLCLAMRAGVTQYVDSFPDSLSFMKWPLRNVCDPLGDKYRLIKSVNNTCNMWANKDSGIIFRGTPNTCKCLEGSSMIETPDGPKPVQTLKKGDLVWSQDLDGNRITAKILEVNKQTVQPGQEYLDLRFSNGTHIRMSPSHPTRTYATADQWTRSDVEWAPGITVTTFSHIPNTDKLTFDILPEGPTGIYYIGGIPIGSTLHENNFLMQVNVEEKEPGPVPVNWKKD